jgi:hypothetical protein
LKKERDEWLLLDEGREEEEAMKKKKGDRAVGGSRPLASDDLFQDSSAV